MFKTIKHDAKMLVFLWLHETLYKTIQTTTGVVLLFLIGLTWSFDLSKLYPLIRIEPNSLALLRMQASGVIFVIYLGSCVLVNLSFRKKYKDYENLTKEEQKMFDKFFKTPSVYEKRGVISM